MKQVSLEELIEHWRMVDCIVQCAGGGELVAKPNAIQRIRGALGHVLATSASEAALSGKECNFSPPCLFDMFHNSHAHRKLTKGRELPRPFVLAVDDLDGDLIITLRIFGTACDRAFELQSALIAAVRLGVKDEQAGLIILPVRFSTVAKVDLDPIRLLDAPYQIHLLSPLIQRGHDQATNEAQTAKSFITGLGNRIAGIARLHDLSLELDSSALNLEARHLGELAQIEGKRMRIERGRKSRSGFLGVIRFPPSSLLVSTLAGLGQWTHTGGDTSHGAGRFLVLLEDR